MDVIVEVTTRSALHEFEAELHARGFTEDQEDGVIRGATHPPRRLQTAPQVTHG